MAAIIKVKCTGREQHLNEIDLEDILGSDTVVYGAALETGRRIPARIVRRCDVCDEGKVIISREMMEACFQEPLPDRPGG